MDSWHRLRSDLTKCHGDTLRIIAVPWLRVMTLRAMESRQARRVAVWSGVRMRDTTRKVDGRAPCRTA
ncbi:jg23592, partial [Pararge aegeria aegeria]